MLNNNHKIVAWTFLILALAIAQSKDYISYTPPSPVQSISNEIETTKYVNQSELNEFFEKAEENGDLIGPWFRLIKEHFIDKIWENISDTGKVRDKQVHNMGEC